MLVALATYAGLEERPTGTGPQTYVASDNKPRDADVALFYQLRDMFDANLIAFYREHNFYTSFNPDRLKPLFDYSDSWHGVEFEFLDSKVEEEHKKFRSKAGELAEALAKYTASGENGLATVKPKGYHGGGLPDWAEKEAKELNVKASDFLDAQQKFFAIARQHLEA